MYFSRSIPVLAISTFAMLFFQPGTVQAYIEAPHSLGQVVNLSTNILVLRVEKVDKDKNLIIYRKVEDLKGTHGTDVIKHNIAKAGFNPREWQYVMEWAEPGKTAVMFHNGGACETFTGTYWYQAYAGGEWWNMSHGEPFLLRSFAGKPEKLIAACKDVLAGKEVIVPCMVNGNLNDLHLRQARIQRLRVSLKLLDYNEKRDFAGWGGEDLRRLTGMPGFTHIGSLARVDPEAQGISCIDVNGKGKTDLCLVSGAKAALFQNAGESYNELSLPGVVGSRAAVWADYNGDGKPDLLLATPTGPKLFTNLGGGQFRDDSHLLPREAGYDLTSAAWLDFDGDGKPDILLGNGCHGLRLYRNKGPVAVDARPLKLGGWYYNGPFDNSGQKGFDRAYPPEKEIDLKKKYRGKNGEEAAWKKGSFTDGEVNNLKLFKPENNDDAVVYLYREIECTNPTELPISLGSDDTLTVWLNGEKLLAENVSRGAAPDQNLLTLKLKKGKNALLMKVCQGTGDWAFYFKPKKEVPRAITWEFEDISTAVGFGPEGIGSNVKGDTLTVADVNGDGKPDILYGAGTGMLLLHTGRGYVEPKDSGIVYKPGKVGPVFADFDNSGSLGLFVPQLDGKCKLFRNDGKGHFTDVTAKSSDLAQPMGMATCAAWGDMRNEGRPDLVVGCLKGPNRYFRNKGDGAFVDATEEIGLHQRIFNTQGIALVDLNGDGMLDMVFNNEGQDSVVLLGNPAFAVGKGLALTVTPAGKAGVLGSRVRLLHPDNKQLALQELGGGEGRGGQGVPHARFALKPGDYKVEVRFSNGTTQTRDVKIDKTAVKLVVDEK